TPASRSRCAVRCAKGTAPTLSVINPSARLAVRSSRTGLPAASERVSFGAPAGSTPHTRASLPAAASPVTTPALGPPPPPRPAPDLRRVRHGLAVVAARVRDHPAAPGGLRQASDCIVRPAQLKRSDRLEAFELQIGVERLNEAQRRTHRHAGEPRSRLPHV